MFRIRSGSVFDYLLDPDPVSFKDIKHVKSSMLCFSNYQADTGIFPDTKYLIKFKAGLKKSFDWTRDPDPFKTNTGSETRIKNLGFLFFRQVCNKLVEWFSRTKKTDISPALTAYSHSN